MKNLMKSTLNENILFIFLVVFLLPGLLLAQTSAVPPSRPLVFVHANLIDMTNTAPKVDMTLVIIGNRIVKIVFRKSVHNFL